MHSLKELAEGLSSTLLLSALGALARACRSGCSSWKAFLSGLAVSAFAGVVTQLMLEDLALSSSLKSALIAISGYSGGAILDAFSGRVLDKIRGFQGGERP